LPIEKQNYTFVLYLVVVFSFILQQKSQKKSQGYEKTDSISHNVPRGDSFDSTEHQRTGD
jgi:hypothetical protein